MTCDLLPLLTVDGLAQMAADEALLERAAAIGRPALRFYIWDPPTLSLGYFQPFADRLPGLPVVRRMTGGGAIVHDHELTYSLALPSGAMPAARGRGTRLRVDGLFERHMPAPSGGHGTRWVCMMHDVIRESLGALGVNAATGCVQERGRGSFLCFQHHTPGDLLIAGHKIGGSAQRRRAGALLQHGSILLAASPHARHLSGIRELTGGVVSPERLAGVLARTFAQMTGWTLVPTDWSPELVTRRGQLAAERYGNPAWTERR